MVSYLQNPIDELYCDEEQPFDDGPTLENTKETPPFNFLSENDFLWEEEELATLLRKEQKEALSRRDEIIAGGPLRSVRDDAVRWILKAVSRHGFSAATAVLAVNYYERFVTSVRFQRDEPWMGQLAAVACVSIAAKVEETHVPLLLDLQVEESKYLFEAKTVRRMELLVLSTLRWKVNLATPISFIDHIARRFRLTEKLGWDFLSRCDDWILSVIRDCRLLHHLPSVIAAATMIHVIDEMETSNAMKLANRITSSLGTSKEKVDECYELIEEMRRCDLSRNKRKNELTLKSPTGIIDAYLSSESSVDSWDASHSSSAEPLLKRSKVFP